MEYKLGNTEMAMLSGKGTNGSFFFYNANNPVLVKNGTLIQLQIKEPYRDSQLNELLYVIIVIVFYATALMTLIITQIRRQRREGSDIDYYDEYLQRNQEVKRTCQTAVKVYNKPPRSPAPPPRSPVPPTLNLPVVETVSSAPVNDEGGGDSGRSRKVQKERSPVHRERSPMLESIPDDEPL